MLLLLQGYGTASLAPSTPSGSGGVAVITSEKVRGIQGENTETIKSERAPKVHNG